MKRIFVLVISLLTMVGCGDEVEFNTPALQGKKDGLAWKATYYDVSIADNGRITIEAGNRNETVFLKIRSLELNAYELGDRSSSEAIFIDSEGLRYSTKNDPDPEFQFYPADGEVLIEKITETTVWGRFRFNAFTNSGLETVNFSQGIFFGLPIVAIADQLISCDEAVVLSNLAKAIYEATDINSPDFPIACANYRDALVRRIVACGGGGQGSVLQNIIDSLNC